MQFSQILVPVDLTEKSRRAVEVAGDLAAAGSNVALLHVIEAVDAPLETVADFYARLQAEAQARLDEHIEQLSQRGVNAGGTIRVGNRAREIIRFAQENDFDLMILHSHRLDPADLMHGLMSISHQVAIAAPCAVLLLR